MAVQLTKGVKYSQLSLGKINLKEVKQWELCVWVCECVLIQMARMHLIICSHNASHYILSKRESGKKKMEKTLSTYDRFCLDQ